MNDYFIALKAREDALEAAWAQLHGPWPAKRSWPPHQNPPCFVCWAEEKHREEPVSVFRVKQATTLFDTRDGRLLVCERHWRGQMREHGYSDADIREQLVLSGHTEAEAEAMLWEDRQPLLERLAQRLYLWWMRAPMSPDEEAYAMWLVERGR